MEPYLEHFLEVVAAGREDDLVGGEGAVLAHQHRVHELAVGAQLAHAADHVGLVVGPLDAELRARHVLNCCCLVSVSQNNSVDVSPLVYSPPRSLGLIFVVPVANKILASFPVQFKS